MPEAGLRHAVSGALATLQALTRPGGYLMEVSAWWPGAGWQFALTNYTGAIEVLPRR